MDWRLIFFIFDNISYWHLWWKFKKVFNKLYIIQHIRNLKTIYKNFIYSFFSLVSSISNIGISLDIDQSNLNFVYLILVIIGGSFFSTSSGLRFLKIYSLTKYSINQILSFSRPKNIFMNKLAFSKINFDTKDINKYFLTILIFVISLFCLTFNLNTHLN